MGLTTYKPGQFLKKAKNDALKFYVKTLIIILHVRYKKSILILDILQGCKDPQRHKTVVAPKFSNILTLFQPGVADSVHHCRGCTKNFPVGTSLRPTKYLLLYIVHRNMYVHILLG